MTAPIWPPYPPIGQGEIISQQLWGGTGSSSFFSASAEMTSLSTQLMGILTQAQANAGALGIAWLGPAGELAVTANSPFEAWLAQAAAHVEQTALHTANAGSAFEMAKGMAGPPAAWQVLDWTCFMMMQLVQMFPFAGIFLTPLINANRSTWGAATAMAVGGYGAYGVESAPLVSHPPLAPPPATATPGVPNSSFASALTGAPSLGGAASVATSLPSSLSQLLQPGSAVSQLTSAPQLASSMAGMPASMASQMGSPTAGSASSGTGGADAANWFGAAAGTGPVTATVSSGGVGIGGLGGAGMAASRISAPGSWSSTANVASPTPNANGVVLSQLAETRAAAATSATSAGMGSPGMVPPGSAARRESSVREEALDKALETAAALYRGPPSTVPVVTGRAGEYFPDPASFPDREEEL